MARRSGQPDQNHAGAVYIIRIAQKLLDQLGTAFPDTQRSQCAVARVGVGSEDHASASRQRLAGIGVDDGLIGGHIDAAETAGGGQAEHVVILIDCPADRTQTVVAVCHGIGDGELMKSAGTGCLNDAYVRDVVRNQRVEFQVQLILIRARGVVRIEDLPGNGLAATVPIGGIRPLRNPSGQLYAAVRDCDGFHE